MADMVKAALSATKNGLSILPIEPGSKKPAWKVLPRLPDPKTGGMEPKWEPFKTHIPDAAEIERMFSAGQWIAVICGAISGNLELMDFDVPDKHNLPAGTLGRAPCWKPFTELVKFHGRESLLKKLLLLRTASGGMHLVYRLPFQPEGNSKLAERQEPSSERKQVLIETRGEGGYFLTYPSPGYEILQGCFEKIPVITEDEHAFLWNAARALNECEELPADRPERKHQIANRPGDDFNDKADWEDILTPHGWRVAGKTSGGRRTWVRPGKARKDGISATTGTGPDLMVVFSTSAAPLECRAYTKFHAYTILEHGGDFIFAAQVLRTKGYGGKPPAVKTTVLPTQGARQLPPDDLSELEEFGEDFEPVTIEYLWEPYLPKGKCVLLDADGGTGKTSLAIAIAAMFSQGITPITGEVCEPAKTLYLHRGEDRSDELETVYRACGGAPGMIRYYRKHDLYFDAEGLERVLGWIEAGKFRLVVVDALFYFLPTHIENTSDNLIAQRVVQELNEVAEATGASFFNQRHTTKGSVGKQAEHLGMGSVAFRNSHRGQLVARFHPEQRGVVVVEDKKGSILVERGDHFAYRRVGAALEFIRNLRNPFDDSKEEPRTALDAAEEFIRGFATDWVYCSALDAQAEAAGISVRGALQRAKNNLNQRGRLEYKATSPGGPRMVRYLGGLQ